MLGGKWQTAFIVGPQLQLRRRPKSNGRTCYFSTAFCCALDPPVAFVLSHFEASEILKLKKHAEGRPVVVPGPFSVDIGRRSLAELVVSADGISNFNANEERHHAPVLVTWGELKRMSKKGKYGAFECYLDGESSPQRISDISGTTQRAASLHPSVPGRPPTMILGGFGMHRIKDTDPGEDTAAKMRAIGSPLLRGEVLDVCTGLGYTALAAAEAANVTKVTTIEIDPIVVSIQRRNPWSQQLFSHPKINAIEGDATIILPSLPGNHYSVIIHDPPAQALGGELYGIDFYQQLKRVCTSAAILFHYIGDPSSRESGRLYRGVMNRLEDAGFRDVRENAGSYGVVARSA